MLLNIAPAMQQVKSLVNAIAGIKQKKPISITANISPAISAINSPRAKLNALPHIKRNITYTYRIVGSRPNPPDINRRINYRYNVIGSRPAQFGMHETVSKPTLILAGEAGKERVDITPNTGVSSFHGLATAGGDGGSTRPIIVNVDVSGEFDGLRLIRWINRKSSENIGGAM